MIKQHIQEQADQCVQCGLCLSHCPTYGLAQNENESPRGRIALMQAWAKQDLQASTKLIQHLDNCLNCNACESVCPSQVPYSTLYDLTHFAFQQDNIDNPGRLVRSILRTLTRPLLLRLVMNMLWLLPKKLTHLPASTHHPFISLLRHIPAKPARRQRLQGYYPTTKKKRGVVGLFLGCIAPIVDTKTPTDSILLLNHLGYDVFVPAKQRCCGALHRHVGMAKQCGQLLLASARAFSEHNVVAILTSASGCQLSLRQTHHDCLSHALPASEYQQLTAFYAKTMDINTFLLQQDWQDVTFKDPISQSIALHTPCTLAYSHQTTDPSYQLLAQVSGYQITKLTPQSGCCGAAGLAMLTHPVRADKLLSPLIQQLAKVQPQTLATSNIGCAIHIQSHYDKLSQAPAIVHPVSLLLNAIQPDPAVQ